MTSEVAPPPAATPPVGYPIRLEITRPDRQSRLTNFPFFIGSMIRAFLAIPHAIILYFLQMAAGIVVLIGTVAILFTGRYPEGLARFYAGYQRWNLSVTGYMFSLYDTYPRFSMDEGEYPLSYQVDFPQASNRILNFPIFGLLFKTILALPHLLILAALGIISFVVVLIAQFGILITGAFPAGMHSFVVGVQRWSARVTGYIVALTDRYPPFSME